MLAHPGAPMSGRSFDLLRAVRDLPLPPPPPELSASDKLVLALLAMRADPTGFCWTSYTTLAANGWMSVRTAKSAIARLVAVGLVEIRVRRVDDGEGGRRARVANGYQVMVKVLTEVVQPQHEVVQLPHEVVQPLHEGSAATAPGVVQPLHGGGATVAHRSATRSATDRSAPGRAPLVLTPEAPKPPPSKVQKTAKHTPEEIAVKTAVLEHFVQRFEAVKGCKPKSLDAGDNAAAFKLAKVYGTDEAMAIIDRAFEDAFVAEKNATLKYIASKADSFRGRRAVNGAQHRNPVQPAPPGGRRWKMLGEA